MERIAKSINGGITFNCRRNLKNQETKQKIEDYSRIDWTLKKCHSRPKLNKILDLKIK